MPARRPLSRARHLTPAAFVLRAAHTAISIAFLYAIAYVWRCALTGHRDRGLRLAVIALCGEALVVTANHGDCPLGGLQQRAGDPTPLFELILTPRAARRAVPVLGAIAFAGIALLTRQTDADDPAGSS